MEMTGRERLLRSFNKQPTDRIAVSPFIHMNFVKEFFQDPGTDLIHGTVDIYRYFGFDLMHRNINIRFDESLLDSPDWRVSVSEEKMGKTVMVTAIVRTPERELKQVVQFEELSAYHRVKAPVEWFIKDREDFDQFVKYQPPIPELELSELKRAQQVIGEEGITAPWFWGVFNYVNDFRKLDDLLVDAITETEFYHEVMEYFLNRLMMHIEKVIRVGVDVVSYSGNIAGGTMVGPEFFMRHIMDYEKRLVDFIQRRNTHVLYHNCGDARNMIEVYNALGIHAFESITEPPYANNDLRDAVDRFSEKITLIGNIDQIDFLRKAGPEEVKLKVQERLEIVKGRKGFILGTSDFLEENTPYENLFAFAEAAKGCR